jgi:hypothetical protein
MLRLVRSQESFQLKKGGLKDEKAQSMRIFADPCAK